jgi:glycosyltransferase involved in cell wall biosynthesis
VSLLNSMNRSFLFIFNTLGPLGGAERQALILIDYLREKGLKVTVLALEDGEKVKSLLLAKKIPFVVYPFKYYCSKWKKVYDYLKLLKIIRRIKPDVLIPYVAESNKVAAELFPFSGAKFVFWNQREEGRGLVGTSKERKLLQKVSAVVSNSTEGQYFLHQKLGIALNQIHVINNGIIIPNENYNSILWHEKLGLQTSDLIITMIANITERKDHATLLKAWARVIQGYKGKSNIKLVLAGRPKHDALNKLKILAFDLKLCQAIEFVEFVDDVATLLHESYFCVFSSNLEGCPNGVLEAMAMKKAVIATDIRGTRQALGEDFTKEELSRPNDSQDLAMKIINLLNNENMVKTLATKNLERIRDYFSVEQMAQGYISLIEKSIN